MKFGQRTKFMCAPIILINWFDLISSMRFNRNRLAIRRGGIRELVLAIFFVLHSRFSLRAPIYIYLYIYSKIIIIWCWFLWVVTAGVAVRDCLFKLSVCVIFFFIYSLWACLMIIIIISVEWIHIYSCLFFLLHFEHIKKSGNGCAFCLFSIHLKLYLLLHI